MVVLGKTVLEMIAVKSGVRGTWRIPYTILLYYINMCENIHNKTYVLIVLDFTCIMRENTILLSVDMYIPVLLEVFLS